MTTLLAVFVVVAGALYALRELRTTLTAKWAKESAAEQRRLDLAERELVLQEQQVAPAPELPPMPDDLKARVFAWEDPWAQEDERRTLYALFEEFKDWEIVKTKLVPLRISLDVDNIRAPREEWMS